MRAAVQDADIVKGDVAKGAATVALSRLGALIEVVTQPIYTWLFGVATYGIYIVLWSMVNLVSHIVDFGVATALQRVIPQADDNTRAHVALKLALVVGVIPSVLIAAAISLGAPSLAPLLNVAPEDRDRIVLIVALFAWALPLWTFVEISTSALRARRAFGPEVRLRIFWEQVVRVVLAVGFWFAGMGAVGLFAAHVASLAVTAALSLRLIGRYYSFATLRDVPLEARMARHLFGYGLVLLPGNVVRRMFVDLPPVLLNAMLPGAAGATAAGLYGIARKIASVPQIVRQTFLYVMAPLASAQARRNRAAIQPLYAFATRLSTALVVPLSVALCLLGDQILALFAPEARAALPLLIVLILGRAIEASAGPAGPVLDVIGHRKWLLFNALAGVAVLLGLGFVLTPDLGALGMGIAVSSGLIVSALLAVVQLRISDRLDALSSRLLIGLGVSTVTGVAMWLADEAATGRGPWIEAVVVFALFLPSAWLGLRLGLTRSDREALGSFGRALRL
jgi:O-antigen/teichoic acid export membrane protein